MLSTLQSTALKLQESKQGKGDLSESASWVEIYSEQMCKMMMSGIYGASQHCCGVCVQTDVELKAVLPPSGQNSYIIFLFFNSFDVGQ